MCGRKWNFVCLLVRHRSLSLSINCSIWVHKIRCRFLKLGEERLIKISILGRRKMMERCPKFGREAEYNDRRIERR